MQVLYVNVLNSSCLMFIVCTALNEYLSELKSMLIKKWLLLTLVNWYCSNRLSFESSS